jgi:hypothetical protein
MPGKRIYIQEFCRCFFFYDCHPNLTRLSASWVNQNHIRYHIRIRTNFKVFTPHKNQEMKVLWLFNSLKTNEFIPYPKIGRINGELCYLSGCRTKNDFLIIISFNKPENAKHAYKERWQIEMF